MANQNNGVQVPGIQFLEHRFKFIENEILRTNLSISFQYIIFLISLEEKGQLQGAISYSTFKNIIIYTASIIEGSLHYCLETLLKRKEVDPDKIFKFERKYTNEKQLYLTEDGIEISGVHIKKQRMTLKKTTTFIELQESTTSHQRAKFGYQLLLNFSYSGNFSKLFRRLKTP